MLTNLAFVFIFVRASSGLVRTTAFLQPVVRVQVYIFWDFATPGREPMIFMPQMLNYLICSLASLDILLETKFK